MTSLERVLSALSGNKPDHTPFTLTLSLYGSRLTGCPITEYYSNSRCYADGQEAVYELCQSDILFGPFALTLEAAAFGCEISRTENSPPFLKKPLVRSASEFLALRLPDIDSNPYYEYIRESVRLMAARFAKTVPVCGVAISPVDLPLLLMGADPWLDALINYPEQALLIIERTVVYFVSWANALLAAGAAFIAVPMMCVNPTILFPKLIKGTMLPAIAAAFAQVKGPIVFHHGGNRLSPHLADYAALPNVAGFVLDQRDSFAEARSAVGEGRLLLGNINGPTLHTGTDELVLAKVRSILNDRRDDPCFIFASSGADVPLQTPPARLRAIAELVRSGQASV